MSVYMTEEEQVEAIKKWWNKHSNLITVIASAILLCLAGYRYWNWHQEKVDQQSSTAYERLMFAVSNKDNKQIRSYANQLITNYGKTVYADVARMSLAKLNVASNKLDDAEAQLESVAHNTRMPALKQIAQVRLARMLLVQKNYDKALSELAEVSEPSYQPIINELKGDIYAAKGMFPKAVASYRKAIDETHSQGMGNLFLEMKTNELAAYSHSLKQPQQPDKQAA